MPSSKSTTALPKKSQQATSQGATQPTPVTTVTPSANSSGGSAAKIALIIIVVLLGLSLLGGLASYFVARSVIQKGIEGATGGKVKVDTGKGGAAIKLKDGSASFTTGKLVDGFPDDVPVYSPATIKLSYGGANKSYSASWSTADSSDKVLAWYKTQLARKGWVAKDNSQVVVGTVSTASYTKDSRELVLIVSGASGTGQQTGINVSVITKASSSEGN